MKTIEIKIAIDDSTDRIATATKVTGLGQGISDQLQVLGIFQNLVQIQQEKINTLARKRV